MPNIGLNRQQSEAVDRFLGAGRRSHNGLVLAALQSGMLETFQGNMLLNYVRTDLGGGDLSDVATYSRTSIDADLDPYYLVGPKQLMAIRNSDSTAVAAAGFPNDTAASSTGVLRLCCRDVNSTGALGVSQEGNLWIPPSTPWVAQFEMIVPTNSYAVGVAFQEIGIMGAGTIATHFVDATKEFGYVDGSNDVAFVSLKFYNGKGYLRIRPATSGTILTSAAFAIPASGKHAYRLEYNYSATSASPAISLFLDDAFVVAVSATLSGGFQFAARACHGASYLLASHTPPNFDIDTVLIALNP